MPTKGPRLLVVDIAVPLALFYGLRALGASDLAALLVGIVPGLITSAVSLVRTRRTDLVGMAVVLSMVGSAVVAVLGGDARMLLVRNAWISLPFAGITLWSLRHPRPICYTVTLAMLPRRARAMEQLWETNAGFRDAWKWITVCWGIASVLDGVIRIVLAYTLPISVVPATDPVITVVTIVVMQVPTLILLRRSGTWHLVFAPRRPTVDRVTDDYVSQARMRALIDDGSATVMRTGAEVGPTWYGGRWWYVPAGAADYQVADPEQSERFDKLRRRAEAVERAQAELDGRS